MLFVQMDAGQWMFYLTLEKLKNGVPFQRSNCSHLLLMGMSVDQIRYAVG